MEFVHREERVCDACLCHNNLRCFHPEDLSDPGFSQDHPRSSVDCVANYTLCCICLEKMITAFQFLNLPSPIIQCCLRYAVKTNPEHEA